jgi:prevent-host-death family protein
MMMNRISSSELQKEFGRFRGEAHSAPVIITSHGRDDLALISMKEFTRLKALDRRAFYAHELPEEVIEGLLTASIPKTSSKFDDEVES